MNEPKVSVIVPVFNNVPFLQQCFDHLTGQTLRDIEIILVDDGSPDREASTICDEYAARDSRVTVIHQENHGSGYAINRGLDIARGEYIAEADCDDIVELDAYEKLYEAAGGCDVVKGIYTGFNNTREQVVHIWPEQLLNRIVCPLELDEEDQAYLIWSTCAMWTALYKKEFLDREGIRMRETPGALFQDTAFTLKTKIFAKTFKCVDIPVYRYRTDNDASSTHNVSNPFALCDEYAEVERWLKERNVNIWPLWARIIFGGYSWMFNQIAEEQQTPFAYKIREDMSHQVLKRDYYSALEWHTLERWGLA